MAPFFDGIFFQGLAYHIAEENVPLWHKKAGPVHEKLFSGRINDTSRQSDIPKMQGEIGDKNIRGSPGGNKSFWDVPAKSRSWNVSL